MELEEYARVAAAEDDHWWFRNTRGLMAELLGPWLIDGGTFLDAGCGPGGNGAWMARHGAVVGVDLFASALDLVKVRHPGTAPVQATIAELPLANDAFDAVACITVLTHLADDDRAVRELARVVKPGGGVLLMEPAFPSLRRSHDVMAHSLRRYRVRDLTAMATRAGLEVRWSSYAYSFLVPPAFALALKWRVRPRPAAEAPSDTARSGLGGFFGSLASLERRRLRRGRVPFGTSAIVLAVRPEKDLMNPA